jgi:hypothetical protein
MLQEMPMMMDVARANAMKKTWSGELMEWSDLRKSTQLKS